MIAIDEPKTAAAGEFCWVDLATTDAAVSRQFYRDLFGWSAHEQAANGGHFTCLRLGGRDVGSLYQISDRLRANGVHSHWLPYVRVANLEEAIERTMAYGGQAIVRPFTVDGIARIALILDAVGAQVGLWECLATADETGDHDE
jgi:predicted enzyme related to lactoylglutathione lyase